MKVFPDTNLYIISGCPCDPDYEHTLYWPNKEGQHAYFMTKAKYRLHEMNYQRAKRGRIRVQYKVEDLYDCNYIAFQNSSFGDKWFYAFIDDVTYVNNITSEISYTIDVIQTWITEMDLQQCFVAREHSVTDVAGENLVPENIDTGELIAKYDYTRIDNPGDLGIIVAQIESSLGNVYEGGFYGNVFSQVRYYSYSCTESGITALTAKLDEVGFFNNPDAVLSIFMCPLIYLQSKGNIPYVPSPPGVISNVPTMETLKRSDGTNVKNKKMQTSPYTFLRVTNFTGSVRDYEYEYFEEAAGGLEFQRSFSWSTNVSLTVSPRGYKVPLTGRNYDASLTYSGFPTCLYACSDFARRLATAGISAGVAAIAGLATGGAALPIIAAAGTSALSGFNSGSVQNTYQADSNLMNMPVNESVDAGARRPMTSGQVINQVQALGNMLLTGSRASVYGNTAAANDLFNSGVYGIYYTQMQPRQEYIDRIDDYFSRYGYATNKIKTPNISSRPHWNYVQTIGCKINGSIPCTDEAAICAIFNKGVTFWQHPEEVGNFSLDNSPT